MVRSKELEDGLKPMAEYFRPSWRRTDKTIAVGAKHLDSFNAGRFQPREIFFDT